MKTIVKWTLLPIYGRFYITDYSQVNIIFETKMRMAFNEVLEKISTYSSFYRPVKNKMGDFRFWIESDAWRVSFCFRSLYIASIL